MMMQPRNPGQSKPKGSDQSGVAFEMKSSSLPFQALILAAGSERRSFSSNEDIPRYSTDNSRPVNNWMTSSIERGGQLSLAQPVNLSQNMSVSPSYITIPISMLSNCGELRLVGLNSSSSAPISMAQSSSVTSMHYNSIPPTPQFAVPMYDYHNMLTVVQPGQSGYSNASLSGSASNMVQSPRTLQLSHALLQAACEQLPVGPDSDSQRPILQIIVPPTASGARSPILALSSQSNLNDSRSTYEMQQSVISASRQLSPLSTTNPHSHDIHAKSQSITWIPAPAVEQPSHLSLPVHSVNALAGPMKPERCSEEHKEGVESEDSGTVETKGTVRKNVCPYCSRACAKPSVLQKHLRAHTGERPFPCAQCGFQFKTKSNLYKHCKSRSHLIKLNQSGTSKDSSSVDAVDVDTDVLETSTGHVEMEYDSGDHNECESSKIQPNAETTLTRQLGKPLCEQLNEVAQTAVVEAQQFTLFPRFSVKSFSTTGQSRKSASSVITNATRHNVISDSSTSDNNWLTVMASTESRPFAMVSSSDHRLLETVTTITNLANKINYIIVSSPSIDRQNSTGLPIQSSSSSTLSFGDNGPGSTVQPKVIKNDSNREQLLSSTPVCLTHTLPISTFGVQSLWPNVIESVNQPAVIGALQTPVLKSTGSQSECSVVRIGDAIFLMEKHETGSVTFHPVETLETVTGPSPVSHQSPTMVIPVAENVTKAKSLQPLLMSKEHNRLQYFNTSDHTSSSNALGTKSLLDDKNRPVSFQAMITVTAALNTSVNTSVSVQLAGVKVSKESLTLPSICLSSEDCVNDSDTLRREAAAVRGRQRPLVFAKSLDETCLSGITTSTAISRSVSIGADRASSTEDTAPLSRLQPLDPSESTREALEKRISMLISQNEKIIDMPMANAPRYKRMLRHTHSDVVQGDGTHRGKPHLQRATSLNPMSRSTDAQAVGSSRMGGSFDGGGGGLKPGAKQLLRTKSLTPRFEDTYIGDSFKSVDGGIAIGKAGVNSLAQTQSSSLSLGNIPTIVYSDDGVEIGDNNQQLTVNSLLVPPVETKHLLNVPSEHHIKVRRLMHAHSNPEGSADKAADSSSNVFRVQPLEDRPKIYHSFSVPLAMPPRSILHAPGVFQSLSVPLTRPTLVESVIHLTSGSDSPFLYMKPLQGPAAVAVEASNISLPIGGQMITLTSEQINRIGLLSSPPSVNYPTISINTTVGSQSFPSFESRFTSVPRANVPPSPQVVQNTAMIVQVSAESKQLTDSFVRSGVPDIVVRRPPKLSEIHQRGAVLSLTSTDTGGLIGDQSIHKMQFISSDTPITDKGLHSSVIRFAVNDFSHSQSVSCNASLLSTPVSVLSPEVGQVLWPMTASMVTSINSLPNIGTITSTSLISPKSVSPSLVIKQPTSLNDCLNVSIIPEKTTRAVHKLALPNIKIDHINVGSRPLDLNRNKTMSSQIKHAPLSGSHKKLFETGSEMPTSHFEEALSLHRTISVTTDSSATSSSSKFSIVFEMVNPQQPGKRGRPKGSKNQLKSPVTPIMPVTPFVSSPSPSIGTATSAMNNTSVIPVPAAGLLLPVVHSESGTMQNLERKLQVDVRSVLFEPDVPSYSVSVVKPLALSTKSFNSAGSGAASEAFTVAGLVRTAAGPVNIAAGTAAGPASEQLWKMKLKGRLLLRKSMSTIERVPSLEEMKKMDGGGGGEVFISPAKPTVTSTSIDLGLQRSQSYDAAVPLKKRRKLTELGRGTAFGTRIEDASTDTSNAPRRAEETATIRSSTQTSFEAVICSGASTVQNRISHYATNLPTQPKFTVQETGSRNCDKLPETVSLRILTASIQDADVRAVFTVPINRDIQLMGYSPVIHSFSTHQKRALPMTLVVPRNITGFIPGLVRQLTTPGEIMEVDDIIVPICETVQPEIEDQVKSAVKTVSVSRNHAVYTVADISHISEDVCVIRDRRNTAISGDAIISDCSEGDEDRVAAALLLLGHQYPTLAANQTNVTFSIKVRPQAIMILDATTAGAVNTATVDVISSLATLNAATAVTGMNSDDCAAVLKSDSDAKGVNKLVAAVASNATAHAGVSSQRQSVYLSWEPARSSEAQHPSGLLPVQLISLYRTQTTHFNSPNLYTLAKPPVNQSGVVTHSSYWSYKKENDMKSCKTTAAGFSSEDLVNIRSSSMLMNSFSHESVHALNPVLQLSSNIREAELLGKEDDSMNHKSIHTSVEFESSDMIRSSISTKSLCHLDKAPCTGGEVFAREADNSCSKITDVETVGKIKTRTSLIFTKRSQSYRSASVDANSPPPTASVTRNEFLRFSLKDKKLMFPGGYQSSEAYVYVRGRGTGRYVCAQCGIRCKKPSMLRKHLNTHTDLRPHQCRICNFGFKTKGNLSKHISSKAHYMRCCGPATASVTRKTNTDGNVWKAVPLKRHYKWNSGRGSLESGAASTDQESFAVSMETDSTSTARDEEDESKEENEDKNLGMTSVKDIHSEVAASLMDLSKGKDFGRHLKNSHPLNFTAAEIINKNEKCMNSLVATDGHLVQIASTASPCSSDTYCVSKAQTEVTLSTDLVSVLTSSALKIVQNPVTANCGVLQLDTPDSGNSVSGDLLAVVRVLDLKTVVATASCIDSVSSSCEQHQYTDAETKSLQRVISQIHATPCSSLGTVSQPITPTPLQETIMIPVPGRVTADTGDESIDGKFICPTCHKSFGKQYQLTMHKNIHYLEKPYRCALCIMSFPNRALLERHIRSDRHVTAASRLNDPSIDPRPFKCDECAVAFRIHGHLAKHLRSRAHSMKLEAVRKISNDDEEKEEGGKDKKEDIEEICTGNDEITVGVFVAEQVSMTESNKVLKSVTENTLDNLNEQLRERVLDVDHPVNHEWKQTNKLVRMPRSADNPGEVATNKNMENISKRVDNIADNSATSASSVSTNMGFTCPFCTQSIADMQDIQRHLLSHVRPFICEVCDAAYVTRESLEAHKANHQQIADLHVCKSCGDRLHCCGDETHDKSA